MPVRATRLVLIVLMSVAVGAGCGSDNSASSTSTANVGGAFVDVPSPGSIHALSPEARTSTEVTQSFEVDGSDAATTFKFYKTQLAAAGWTEVQAGPSGDTDFRGVWTKDQVQLTVSTSPLRPAKSGSDSQLNLQRST